MTRPVAASISRALSQAGADRAIPGVRADVDRLREQLATGYRIQRPSDDPAGYAQARALGRVEQRLAAHERSLDAATLWTDRTQAELGSIADLFSEANEAAIRAANGPSDAGALASQIESLRVEVIAHLNAKSGDEYLFAGNETRTAPLGADGAVAAGEFSGTRSREVAPGVTLALNVPGADTLYLDSLPAPDRLQALADAIRAGDATAIQDGIAMTKAGVEHYSTLAARSGTARSRLDDARASVEAQSLQASEARAQIEEIDLLEVYGALQQRQTGLEAALRATAAAAQQTLLNYL